MRLILVRHGAAHAGFHGVIGGPEGCAGLTAEGRRQAEALRDHLARTDALQADALVTSVIRRAIQTADIIAPALGFETVPQHCDLCEVHTGEADGMEWAEYTELHGGFDMVAEPDRLFAAGGESWNSFHGRVQQMLDRVAREHEGQTVVAVCHAGVIMASMRLLLGIPIAGELARMQPTNTGLTEWEHDEVLDRWTLHRFNDASHLVKPS